MVASDQKWQFAGQKRTEMDVSMMMIGFKWKVNTKRHLVCSTLVHSRQVGPVVWGT